MGPKTIKLLSACNFKSVVVVKNLIAQLASFFFFNENVRDEVPLPRCNYQIINNKKNNIIVDSLLLDQSYCRVIIGDI